MIAWWHIPTIFTIYALLQVGLACRRDADIWQFGIAFTACGFAAVVWATCFILRFLQ